MNPYEREILGPGLRSLATSADSVAEGSAALRGALGTVTAVVSSSDGQHLPTMPVDVRAAGRRLAASSAAAVAALAELEADLQRLAEAARRA